MRNEKYFPLFFLSENPLKEHVKELQVDNDTHRYFSLPDLKDDRYGEYFELLQVCSLL